MQVIHDPEAFRHACQQLRQRGRLGFVPTMGALHAGHLQLVRFAGQQASSVAVSIFVNPTQFGPGEDLASYPRTLEADCAACEQAGAALVFAPSPAQMYLPGERTRVRVTALTETLCGATRPGHFDGVCTVVSKLLLLTGECVAVFGRKDFQQWKVVQRMARDLFLPVEILGHPIVREADGLAMSSRNRYLSAAERTSALGLVRGLNAAQAAYAAGEREPGVLQALCAAAIADAGLRIQYVQLVDSEQLQPLSTLPGNVPAVLAVAAHAGATRLIDNRELGEAE
jgi:pantoate--beta-alanine ligase